MPLSIGIKQYYPSKKKDIQFAYPLQFTLYKKHIRNKNQQQNDNQANTTFREETTYQKLIFTPEQTNNIPLRKWKMDMVRKQPWFDDYQTATKFNAQQNYTDALRYYYKVIQTMQTNNQKGQAYYYRMFDKVLKINVLLNRPLQAQENLYKLIKVKKALQKNPILVYEDYQNLLIHQVNHNVEKAIKLGKALLSESQIRNLPINNQKYIRMLLGNAYLLVENYTDAKKKYGQVLEMKPNHYLKGITLNNLSIACWWHKNPMFPNKYQHNLQYQQLRMNRDFNQTKQLLMNSIGSIQNIEDMSQSEAIALENLLNENPDSMLALSLKTTQQNNIYSIKERETLQPVYNLIQYYIYNDPIQKPLIMAWMRILLKSAAKFHMQEMIDEVTAKYYLLNGQVLELKKLLHSISPKYESFVQSQKGPTHLSTKLQLLQIYKMMNLVNKVSLSNPLQFPLQESKLKNLQNQLTQKDAFIFKRQFLMSEQLSFMKKSE